MGSCLLLNGSSKIGKLGSVASPDQNPTDDLITSESKTLFVLTSDVQANRISLLVAALFGTILSLLSTGFIFGTGNNLFHLGIIGKLYDLPQYRDDGFIQSLRYYAAGPWLLLAGAGNAANAPALFFTLLFLSRFLSLIGFLLCASLIGIASFRDRLIFASIIATCSALRGLSLAGGGGLFIPEFTHSEIANGLTLIMLSCLGRRRLFAAILLNALVFFTNAFFAVWNALPLLIVTAYWLRTGRLTTIQAIRQVCFAILPALAIAAPILADIRANPHYGQSLYVDYLTFLIQYWPLHFLIWKNSPGAILGLAVIVAVGFWGLYLLRPRNPVILLSALAYTLVYDIGIVMPFLTHDATILNLHLLRSSTCLHIIMGFILASLATRWLASTDLIDRLVLAPLLLLALCSLRALIPLSIIPLAIATVQPLRRVVQAWMTDKPHRRRLPAATISLLMLGLWGIYGQQQIADLRDRWRQVHTWMTIGEWASHHTPSSAIFLLPTKDIRPQATPPQSFAGDTAVFEFASHRRVWVDFIRGAAVMWMPSYYTDWNSRIWPVLALRTPEARMDYARQHGITYLVESCALPHPDFSIAGLCVYATDSDGKLAKSL